MKRAPLSLFALVLAACHSDTITVQAQLAVSTHTQLAQTLRVLIDVDDQKGLGEGHFADAIDSPVVIELEVESGKRVFQVRIESTSFAGVTLLQSVRKTVNITGGATVSFVASDFNVDEFDDDSDGLSNWEEFKRGCHPSSTDCEWQSVSAGREHTCALKTNGDLYCFGANNSDQLGTFGGEPSSTRCNSIRRTGPCGITWR